MNCPRCNQMLSENEKVCSNCNLQFENQPPQGEYQQPQGAYPPPQGAYPPPQGAYPPPQGAYPPPQGAYPPPPPMGYIVQPRYNPAAITGFVLSCVSIFLYAIGLGVAGLIVSIVGLNQATRRGERGKGLAIAGLAIGAFTTLLFLIFIFALASFPWGRYI